MNQVNSYTSQISSVNAEQIKIFDMDINTKLLQAFIQDKSQR